MLPEQILREWEQIGEIVDREEKQYKSMRSEEDAPMQRPYMHKLMVSKWIALTFPHIRARNIGRSVNRGIIQQ